MTPAELAADLVDAYNERDDDRLRRLFADPLAYTGPGGSTITGAAEVMDLYHLDWGINNARSHIRRMVESGEWVAFEFTMVLPDGSGVDGSVFQRWVGDRLVESRTYFDPLPTP